MVEDDKDIVAPVGPAPHPRCQEFFARALALEPERRPDSARMLLSELERALV